MLKIQRKQNEPTVMWAHRYPSADLQELKRIAKREGVSVSELAKQVLRNFIGEWKSAKRKK